VGLKDFDRLSDLLPDRVRNRARHVVEEIERTNRARKLLIAGDVSQFGYLMNQCHTSLRDLYEVSSFELDTMVNIAQGIKGCYGARLTGAGFGGCTVNLVASDDTESFISVLQSEYQRLTNINPKIFISQPADGAGLIE